MNPELYALIYRMAEEMRPQLEAHTEDLLGGGHFTFGGAALRPIEEGDRDEEDKESDDLVLEMTFVAPPESMMTTITQKLVLGLLGATYAEKVEALTQELRSREDS